MLCGPTSSLAASSAVLHARPSVFGKLHALYAASYAFLEIRPLPWNMSRSFCSELGPLQVTSVAVPPQQALPSARPLRLIVDLKGSLLTMK